MAEKLDIPMIPSPVVGVTGRDGRTQGCRVLAPEEIIEMIEAWRQKYPDLAADPVLARRSEQMLADAKKRIRSRRD